MVDVLKSASAGLALRGVHLAHFEDSVKLRLPLLAMDDVEGNVELQNPLMGVQQVTSETLTAEDFVLANQALRSIGFGVQNDWKAGLFGSTVQAGYDKVTLTTQASHRSKTFYGLTKNYFLPVASYTFDKFEMKLSKSALKSLRTIEAALKSEDELLAQMRGFNFFREYGSHAAPGPIHFGGTLSWTAVSENFSSEEFQRVAMNASKSLEAKFAASGLGRSVSVGLGGWSDSGQGERNVAKADNDNVQVSMESFGGPLTFESVETWKRELMARRDTWAVISKGILGDFIPVWEIIRLNHKQDFDLTGKLSDFLCDVFDLAKKASRSQNLIFKLAHEEVERQLLSVEENFELASGWNLEDAEQHVANLLHLKKKVFLSSNGVHLRMGSAENSHLVRNFIKNVNMRSDSQGLVGAMVRSFVKNEPNLIFEDHECSLGEFQHKICDQLLRELSAETLKVVTVTMDQEFLPKVLPFHDQKSAFLNHAMKYLNTKQDFSLYQAFFSDPVPFLRHLLEETLIEIFFAEEEKKLQVLDLFQWGVDLIEAKLVDKILRSHEKNRHAWIQNLSEVLSRKYQISCTQDLIENVIVIPRTENLDEVKSRLIRSLSYHSQILAKQMKVESKEGLIQGLVENKWTHLTGCLALCPFCMAVCSHKVDGHKGKHFSTFHRPGGFVGVKDGADASHLEVLACPELVKSQKKIFTDPSRPEISFPYSDYGKQGEGYSCWSFESSEKHQISVWNEFLDKFTGSLESHYNAAFRIPLEVEDEVKEMSRKVSSSWVENSFFLAQI